MTPERWRQIEELFHSAREHGLAALADADPDLRYEVERLLEQDGSDGKILDRPAAELTLTIVGVGSQLGPYKIEATLGAGGMGEVYRARDTKLKRDVAIKILPEAFARDRGGLARFQREAEVLAFLNHPNIAHIYGVEEGAIVMELVDGQSPKGPLPFDEAWKIAMQIADALEYAHEKGVIHRDLKPANVRATPQGVVKLLDFGIAKAFSRTTDSGSADFEKSPVVTLPTTVPGTIMGTAAYMAPEQAQGKNVDKRADIWSWAVILYELLTGERMFKGNDFADTLVQVLTKPPDLDRIPVKARRLMAECLQKDPKHRLRDIGDARRLLTESESTSQPARRLSLGWIAAVVIAVVLGATLWRTGRFGDPPFKPLVRLDVALGTDISQGSRSGPDVIISPDGARLVYVSQNRLFTRRLDQSNARELAGTEEAFAPFFSPDGRWVAFFAGGKLKKISVEGGAAIPLCNVVNGRGGAWGEDGNIIEAAGGISGLERVPATGGTPTPVTELAQGEATHRWPQILPGGKAVLFTSNNGSDGSSYDAAKIEVMSLADHRRKVLEQGMFGRYVAPSRDGAHDSGYLLYVDRGALFAVPFDSEALEVRGTPVPVLEEIASSTNFGFAEFDFSPVNGTLVYRSGGRSGGELRTIQWLDSRGKIQPLLSKPDTYEVPRISPDGQRLALSVAADIFVYDLQRDNLTRLTFDRQSWGPLWYPDGRYIVFHSPEGMSWTRSDGAAKTKPLIQGTQGQSPWSFTRDGKNLVFQQGNAKNDWDLWTVPVESDSTGLRAGKPQPFLQTAFNEREASFSPDGRWLAYASDESGIHQVYVRAFPDNGIKRQVSSDGGLYPVWSRNGRELFYLTEDSAMIMVAAYTVNGDSFMPNKPRVWSEKPLANLGFLGINYDVAPDGKRIVALMPTEATPGGKQAQNQVTFLLNFADELRRRVPIGK